MVEKHQESLEQSILKKQLEQMILKMQDLLHDIIHFSKCLVTFQLVIISKEAIHFAWEFLTSENWMGMEPEKLYVTIHPEDSEAYRIWNDEIGLEESRIIRIEGNFWDIGEGPSGPNTEIFYDRGDEYGQDDPSEEMYPGGENERYLEVWNLVFSEFNHNKDNTYTPLPNKNIDTGMGLERMASVSQNVRTNYETDLFMPIINEVEKNS